MKLPDKIFGIETSKAYQDYLERAEKKGDSGDGQEQPRIKMPASSSIQNANSYLILPGKKHGIYEYPDLLVSTTRSHNGEDWNRSHEFLKQEDSFMLALRQYVDFLNMLRSGNAYDGSGKKVNKSALDGILEDITKVKSPWRAEWLDAKFSSQNGKLQITYHDYQGNEVIEPLESCLMRDKTAGIDLSYWLDNATPHGLPPSDNSDGNLYYWHPRNNAVARFGAGSVWAVLGCDWYPVNSDASLGVRAAKIR